MYESQFQSKFVKELKSIFKEAIITKNDPTYIQGIPDLTIFNGEKWATLECKKSREAPKRPNQERYVDRMNKMSFSRFVYPENKTEVIEELKEFFEDF